MTNRFSVTEPSPVKISYPEPEEHIAVCPGCGTWQTIWLDEGMLVPTRKFIQSGKRIFHDCGTIVPCHVY